ncbi:DEAD/DEAH box helicase [Nakamurella multipartita]|uniref:RNA helicase n=1 Tax=Nakamurella multipartita (strain ATCC 700099 / DSM 44233 / CIP 104796 / JCM 9543 / NBRC 105858 / Y-104) TaxID=479431 RepID=C8XJ80_NAKMY|nr:DEAD/DEAH box helicase [Nakamurella multipartita]ACV78545.1 DEAD/DEAH box helicase domain protein [Nakamurella multipartita DSM 44233]
MTQHNLISPTIEDPDGVVADAAIDPDDAALSHPLTADADIRPESPTFAEFGVDERIVTALADVGIERTFAIQALTLPIALTGSDLIGQARTGMGKTLGFGVPLLQRLSHDKAVTVDEKGKLPVGRAPRAVVMVPTRELCVQVTRDLHALGKALGLAVTAVYGGRAYEPQIKALQAGVDLVVGTPGRLLDLANSGHLVLGGVKVLVLDEADEMLDLGFLPDMEKVLDLVPTVKQTMLFSATMPGPILTLARTFMSRPMHIRAEAAAEGAMHSTTRQFVYRAHALDKVEMLARVLQARGRGLTMVFTRTKRTAAKVAEDLEERGFAAAAVHGDLGQGAREQALRAFRAGKVDVLVATDVAARGIDVDDVTHVINFQCPEEEKTYVHRIGRTGRAGKTGTAVSFIDWDDIPRWQLINQALELNFNDPVETYSTSPHLFAELDIPEGTTGELPRAARTRAGLDAEQVEDLGETGGKRRSAGRTRTKTTHADRPARADRPADGDPAAEGDGGTGGRRRQRTRGARSADRPVEHAIDHPASPDETGAAAGPSTEGTEGAPKARRRRSRRRTRSGQPVTEGAHEAAQSVDATV